MDLKKLIKKMTLEEKAALLSGKTVWKTRDIPRLKIPSIFLSDGPHGIRKQAGEGDHLGLNASIPATCFPTAATMANSWDEALVEEVGGALGEEAAALDVDVVLGPGLNMKRSPLCGRNFEYYSEDPYLAGKMAAACARGIQSQGVYSCIKHFAVNSQEERRMAMNAVVDERTLREIYLTGFEIAVKEGGAKAVMTSYNEVNGVYANENPHLLKDILRGEWGFDGIVVTDWGGSNDHVEGVRAGSDLEMPAPGLGSARELIAAVREGRLKEEILDSRVEELLRAVKELHVKAKHRKKSFDKEAHHALAGKAARESAVLLKNEDSLLPLRPHARVAIVGDFALEPRYQGAGSSLVNSIRVETARDIAGTYDLEIAGTAKGYQREGAEDGALLNEAVELAKKADVVLYFFGLNEISESEGLDRTHMRIPENQIVLLNALAKEKAKIVGILSGGAAVEMPWEKNLHAILHGYLNGQAGAGAIFDLLTGKTSPSGRLNETYPLQYKDTPAFCHYPAKERNAEYREGLYIGYRYYDTAGVKVQYPFGYGLSYTSFAYSELKIDRDSVSFMLKNTGDYDGAEVAQLYVGLPDAGVFRPLKELKGFKKVFLKAGESCLVQIALDDKAFRYWNVLTNRWEIEEGDYKIMVGAHVEDIRLEGTLHVTGTTEELPYNMEEMPSYASGKAHNVGDQEFTLLLGHSIPDGKWKGKLGINDAICQMYYAKSFLARSVFRFMESKKKKSEASGKPDLNILFIYNMPFRGIAKMSGGMADMNVAHGILEIVNGHFFKGFGKTAGSFFSNLSANRKYEKKLKKR